VQRGAMGYYLKRNKSAVGSNQIKSSSCFLEQWNFTLISNNWLVSETDLSII